MTESLTPLDLIKLGIQTNDMTQVQKAYKLMTCEQVSIGSTVPQEESYIAQSNPTFGRGDRGNHTLTKKVPVKIRPGNMFVDDEDGRDKRPQKAVPLKKVAKSNIFVEVTCWSCGETKKINRQTLSISVDENEQKKGKPYKCDECIASRR